MGTHHRCTWNCGGTDCDAPTRTTLTTWEQHGMQPGDVVVVHEARWRKLRKLLTRPRVTEASEVTATTFVLRERRMTWREWWRAIQATIFG